MELRIRTAVEDERRLWTTTQSEMEVEMVRAKTEVQGQYEQDIRSLTQKCEDLEAELKAHQATAKTAAAVDVTGGDAYNSGMFGRESIHALLRQKDGEVKGLQSSLVAAEASNAALAEEVAEVTRQNDSLRAGANSAADADEKMEALQARHAAALEILGEKAEQLQAAQEDLDDLREWMRSHALNSVTTDG